MPLLNDLENATGYSITDLSSGQTFGGSFGALPTLPPVSATDNFASKFGTWPVAPNAPTAPVSIGSAAGSGGSVSGTLVPSGSSGAPNNPMLPAVGGSTGVGPQTGSLQDYFLRAVIIILGFIFVAVGLHMFAPTVVPDVRNVVRR